MNRNQVLEEAKAAINRAPKSYGNPREHFERVARHWNAHLQSISFLRPVDLNLGPTDVAIMLGLVKIARLEHDPQHADSWCDLAGYAACGAEVSEPAVPFHVTNWGSGSIVEVNAGPGETLYEAMQRTQRCLNAYRNATAAQEPAWKRAKVGDRIRIREGARNQGRDHVFPLVATVTDTTGDRDCRVVVKGQFVTNSDVFEILPPLPESKFGFTVGETVNAIGEKPGRQPATVIGFNDTGILLTWQGIGPSGQTWYPNELRHGA